MRFAGEAPLRDLVVALREGRNLGAVPGLTTRAGDGPPAPVTSALPLRIRPLRGERPELLGHGVAHLQATRGCVGRCAYCGPAALQALEVAEGERAGAKAATLRRLGVGGVRRRPVADLCAESDAGVSARVATARTGSSTPAPSRRATTDGTPCDRSPVGVQPVTVGFAPGVREHLAAGGRGAVKDCAVQPRTSPGSSRAALRHRLPLFLSHLGASRY